MKAKRTKSHRRAPWSASEPPGNDGAHEPEAAEGCVYIAIEERLNHLELNTKYEYSDFVFHPNSTPRVEIRTPEFRISRGAKHDEN